MAAEGSDVVRGVVSDTENGLVCGWIEGPAAASARVELVIDGVVVVGQTGGQTGSKTGGQTVGADAGGRRAFALKIPVRFRDGRRLAIEVRAGGHPVATADLRLTDDFNGRLVVTRQGRVQGWVINRLKPDQALSLDLVVDGRASARIEVTASGDPNRAPTFDIPLPDDAFDGEPRIVSLGVVGTAWRVPGSGKRWRGLRSGGRGEATDLPSAPVGEIFLPDSEIRPIAERLARRALEARFGPLVGEVRSAVREMLLSPAPPALAGDRREGDRLETGDLNVFVFLQTADGLELATALAQLRAMSAGEIDLWFVVPGEPAARMFAEVGRFDRLDQVGTVVTIDAVHHAWAALGDDEIIVTLPADAVVTAAFRAGLRSVVRRERDAFVSALSHATLLEDGVAHAQNVSGRGQPSRGAGAPRACFDTVGVFRKSAIEALSESRIVRLNGVAKVEPWWRTTTEAGAGVRLAVVDRPEDLKWRRPSTLVLMLSAAPTFEMASLGRWLDLARSAAMTVVLVTPPRLNAAVRSWSAVGSAAGSTAGSAAQGIRSVVAADPHRISAADFGTLMRMMEPGRAAIGVFVGDPASEDAWISIATSLLHVNPARDPGVQSVTIRPAALGPDLSVSRLESLLAASLPGGTPPAYIHVPDPLTDALRDAGAPG